MLCLLPTELLECVLRYVPNSDLQQVRLVSHYIHDAATPLTFHHFHTGFFIFSLHNFIAISRSRLAKHVKKLTFHPELLPSWTRAEWQQNIDFRPPFSQWILGVSPAHDDAGRSLASQQYDALSRHSFTPPELDAGWRAFQARSAEQSNWREHNEGMIFRECFSSLPNLTEAVVQPAKPYVSVGRLNDSPFWSALVGEIFVGPDAWSYGSRDDLLDGAAALSLLEAAGFRVSFAGVKKLEKLTLDILTNLSLLETMGCTYGSRGERDPTNHPERYHAIFEAFRSLRELVLSCPHAPDVFEADAGGQAEEMLDLLRSAKEVRKLGLMYGNAEKTDFSTYPANFGLGPFFAGTKVTWPHLTSLSLEAATPAEPFTNFLSLHSDTLRRLEIRDAVSDNWRAVLESLPRVCRLDHVYLECLWNWKATVPNDEDEDEIMGFDEGSYVCYFDEGTDGKTDENAKLRAFLLRGEGTLEL